MAPQGRYHRTAKASRFVAAFGIMEPEKVVTAWGKAVNAGTSVPGQEGVDRATTGFVTMAQVKDEAVSDRAVNIAAWGQDHKETRVVGMELAHEAVAQVVAVASAGVAAGGLVVGQAAAGDAGNCLRRAILLHAMAGSDADIIQAVLNGDADRYAELVDKYQETALNVAFSLLGNEEDAKDASQEAFVSAFRSLRHFRGGAKFSTWLYRIVVNECKDVYKRRARQPLVVAAVGSPRQQRGEPDADLDGAGLFVDVEDSAANPRDQLANRELGRQLSSAIGRLPMKQRTAFLLHHVHGLPLEEVASVMHCRLGTVKSHVFRATHHLQEALS